MGAAKKTVKKAVAPPQDLRGTTSWRSIATHQTASNATRWS